MSPLRGFRRGLQFHQDVGLRWIFRANELQTRVVNRDAFVGLTFKRSVMGVSVKHGVDIK